MICIMFRNSVCEGKAKQSLCFERVNEGKSHLRWNGRAHKYLSIFSGWIMCLPRTFIINPCFLISGASVVFCIFCKCVYVSMRVFCCIYFTILLIFLNWFHHVITAQQNFSWSLSIVVYLPIDMADQLFSPLLLKTLKKKSVFLQWEMEEWDMQKKLPMMRFM